MDSRRLHFRTVALIAAYAVALQGLLSAFLPLAPSAVAAPFAVLCSDHGADGSGTPVRHEMPCAAICAALSHGISAPLPPEVTLAVADTHSVQTLNPVNDWVTPRIAIRGPHAPRGPPLA